jgi:Flp pilus assembly protein TadB
MHNLTLERGVTSPETAWLVSLVPVALTIASILIVVFVLRRPLLEALAGLNSRRAGEQRASLPEALIPDPSLIFIPPATPPHTVLAMGAAVACLLSGGLIFTAPVLLALLLAGPATALLVWALMRWYEVRYVDAVERDLTAAVGRLSAMLRSGNSFRISLTRILADMSDGPLKAEWSFLVERAGVPLVNREGIATNDQLVAALAVQTPSRRHATFLNHLSVAVSQPHDVLVTRVISAYDALQSSDRRREEAVTELAQMRYSGLAVGMAGLVMALYLAWTQWDRVTVAYATPLGVVVGVIVVFALLLPIGGGIVLARADDVDY